MPVSSIERTLTSESAGLHGELLQRYLHDVRLSSEGDPLKMSLLREFTLMTGSMLVQWRLSVGSGVGSAVHGVLVQVQENLRNETLCNPHTLKNSRAELYRLHANVIFVNEVQGHLAESLTNMKVIPIK